MNPGFRNNFPGFWDIHSDQMMNPNEAQDRYRPGQLFLRQQIPQNTFPPATAVLAPFQPLQPAQAGCSGTAPLPLAPTPPETPEPQEASESGNSGKAGRGYGKWGEEEEKLLVQLWCDKHTRLESRHARQVWEEIAQEISKIRKVTSAQCQRKMKYLKDRYKEAKDHNRHKTGGERKTSPFYDEIDSVLGCRDIVTFSHIEESAPGSSSSSPNSNGKEGRPEDDEEFEQSLAAFGLKQKKERKSQHDQKKARQRCKSSAQRTRRRQYSFPREYEEVAGAGRQNFWVAGINGKKSSAAAPAHESIYEQFYASNAIINGQVVIQNNYLFDVIIIARFPFLLI